MSTKVSYKGNIIASVESETKTLATKGKYLVDNIKIIDSIPDGYYDMSSEMSFLGKDVECIDEEVYSSVFKLSDTGYNTWTPSTTAKAIVTSQTLTSAFTATDLTNYEYFIVWECGVDPVYDSNATQKAMPQMARSIIVQEILRRPSSWTNIQGGNANSNACIAANTTNFLKYYGTTTGTSTYTWGISYGFYGAATSATFSSSTNANPVVNIKTPAINARCSTTYFSTDSAASIDQEHTYGFIRGKIYKVKRDGFVRGVYNQLISLINENIEYIV